MSDKRVNEFIKLNAKSVRLAPLTADPAGAELGEMWFRSDLDAMCIKLNAGVLRLEVADE